MKKRLKKWEQPPCWLEWEAIKWLRKPYVQIRLGAILLCLSTFTWIVSQVVNHFWGTEPPTILGLSWLGVWLIAWTLILLTDLGENVK